MRKMTENEIIKALELCGHRQTGCAHCPYFGIGGHERRNRDVLDLINRQKAEIERLKEKLNNAESCVDELEYAYEKVGHSKQQI